MFVLCPHCQFLVALEPATGQPPEQCPRCRERLRDAAQSAPPGEADAGVQSTPAPIDETAPVTELEADVVVIADETALPEPAADALDVRLDDPDVASNEPADVIATTEHVVAATTSTTRSNRWPSAPVRHRLAVASVPLLAILLLLQSLLSDRARLAADARWRPLMIVLCDALRCTLPPWREPAAFTLLDRDVRPDPHRAGVLHVSAGFRNDARWSQPWPALLLTLSDADGRVAGARAFRPAEYLAAPVTQNRLASGQSAKVSFDVVEPTRDVVAFTFDFR